MIGITGSVGKTTTKDLLQGCLASAFEVAASERSFNNELGLPLTLLNAPDDVEWVVLEMGARGAGHITRLTDVGRPDVGIVTCVAMAHVEFFGDLEGVARAKSELVAALPPTGVAVLNFDDPYVARMASVSPCPILSYALGDADVRAEARRPRRRSSTAVRVVDTVGRRRGPARAARDAAGPQCAGRRRGGAVERSPVRRRGDGSRHRHGITAAHGGAARPRRSRPGRRLLQRQPGLHRGGAAVARVAAVRSEAGFARADGRAGLRDRGRTPTGGPVG